MKTYDPIWREKFQVRSYDIGLNARMRMSSICSYFQEIAGMHATHLDVGYHFMQQTGKVWVLSRLFVNISEIPGWRQEFFVETWPLGIERIFYRRDYRIHDGENTLITAASYWLLLDLKTRRPTVVPIPDEVIKANEGRFAMTMPSSGFPAVNPDRTETHNVKYSDLDQNRHVNNARYVEWIFDLLDPLVLEKKSPAFFSIEYKHEVKAGDSVRLSIAQSGDLNTVYAVEGRIEESDQVCFRSKIEF